MPNKSFIKGFISGILVVILASNIVFAASTYLNIKVSTEKVKLVFDGVEKFPANNAKPIIYSGKVYVPIDFVAAALGKAYKWDTKNHTVYIGQKTDTPKPLVVKMTDESAQLTLPVGWKKNDTSNSSYILYCSNNNSIITAYRAQKSLVASDATINDYYTRVTGFVLKKISNAQISQPVSLTINGYPALQFEVNCEVSKSKVTYFYTLVQTEDSYYQLIALTGQDTYSKYKKDFIQIFGTFKEIK